MRKVARFCLAVCVAASGCGAPPPPSPAVRAAEASRLLPADPRLAGLYRESCAVCHTNPDAKAPLTGDAEAWKPRLAKGLPVLVQNAAGGFGSMPAGGQCFSCTSADLEALIRFMAKREDAVKKP